MILEMRGVDEEELSSLLSDPDSIEDRERLTDLDKAWHAVHFLLCGKPQGTDLPLGFLLGGHRISEIEVGYEPARVIVPGDVKEVAAALAPLSRDTLAARYDAEEMLRLKIYPEIWRDDDEHREYVLENFDEAKQFVERAAANGWGLVLAVR